MRQLASSYLLLLTPIILLHSLFPLVSSDNSLYNNFLQCLKTQTNNNSNIANILYSKENSPQYSSVLTSYIRNLRFTYPSTPKPALIITPRTPSHVSAGVTCSRELSLHVRLRSGGHDYEGVSYVDDVANFVILDMSEMRAVRVDPVARTAYVEAGATLGELYYRIQQKSKTLGFPAGVCPTVGVGGHVSGGGYGNMLRKYGLSIDHVIDAVVVGPDGRVYNNRTAMGEDLFWAIRGGGGASFGVVVSFTVNLVQVPEKVTVFNIKRFDAVELVYKWQFVMREVDPNLFIRLLLQPVTDPTAKRGKTKALTTRVTFISLFLGDSTTLLSLLNSKFPELGVTKEDCLEMSWGESLLYWANYDIGGTPLEVLLSRNYTANYSKRKSDYVVTPISKVGLGLIMSKLAQIGKPGLVFNPYGGRMSEIPATATAFPHRAGNLFKIQYSTGWKESGKEAEDKNLGLIRELYSFTTPYVSKNPRGAYLNYRDLDIGVNLNGTYVEGAVYGRKYFLGNFDRLVKVKSVVDPSNFFSYEQSIPVLKS